MNAQHNVALVQECYAAFGVGDLARMHATMAPGISWDHPASAIIPWAGHFDGHDGVTRFVTALGEQADVEVFEPHTFVASGDHVVVLGRERFRSRATGRAYATEWAHVFTVTGGKITAFREHTDTAAIEAAFGAGAARTQGGQT